MRVELPSPRIVGFRGGNEEFDQSRPKAYLNLYVVAKDRLEKDLVTPAGGLRIDSVAGDFNPEIIQISTNHLTQGLDPTLIYNVGDQIDGSITGTLTFQKNIFGGGEFAIVMPSRSDSSAFQTFSKRKSKSLPRSNNPKCHDKITDPIKSVRCKPVTTIKAPPEMLTVATFNLENLAGHQENRIAEFAKAFTENLKCPDIINLVEIQDYNGLDFAGSSAAAVTMNNIIEAIDKNIALMKNDSDKSNTFENSPCFSVQYQGLNIDPDMHSEGGQPGGNIRVAMLYNDQKLGFEERKEPPLTIHHGVFITNQGDLSANPGRVAPNDDAFKRTRRSIVAQFSYKGEKLFILGNHLNSKLGDSSHWGNIQPAKIKSDFRRIAMANQINEFVRRIQFENPNANIIVLGDFNAYATEQSMKNLEGDGDLINLTWSMPKDQRYTTNYNGSSQSLDYIFVNPKLHNHLIKAENIHINSDYMGRLSDHDPVMALFDL